MDMRFLELPRYVDKEVTEYEAYKRYGQFCRFAYSQLYKNFLRTVLSERQNHKCCYCGGVMNDIPNNRRQVSIEHVIPESNGGLTDLWNCVAAHRRCNSRRQTNALVEEKLVVLGLTNDQQFVIPYVPNLEGSRTNGDACNSGRSSRVCEGV